MVHQTPIELENTHLKQQIQKLQLQLQYQVTFATDLSKQVAQARVQAQQQLDPVELVSDEQWMVRLRQKMEENGQLEADLKAMEVVAGKQEQEIVLQQEREAKLFQSLQADVQTLEKTLEQLVQATIPNFNPFGLKSKPRTQMNLNHLDRCNVLINAFQEVVGAFKTAHATVKDKLKQQIAKLQQENQLVQIQAKDEIQRLQMNSNEVQELRTEVLQFQQNKAQLEAELNQLRPQVSQLSAQNQQLRNNLQVSAAKNSELILQKSSDERKIIELQDVSRHLEALVVKQKQDLDVQKARVIELEQATHGLLLADRNLNANQLQLFEPGPLGAQEIDRLAGELGVEDAVARQLLLEK